MSTDNIQNLANRAAISDPLEREAVGLLFQSGWSTGELAMTFQCSESAIHRVLNDTGVRQ
jgi:DNA-directed RNA polymerase specialized sigma24 family protein